MKPTIRQATPEDFATILRMLVQMHEEVGEFPLSVDKVSARIDLVLKHGIVLLAYAGDEPVGTMGLVAEEPWYSEQTVIADSWIFTRGRKRLSAFNTMVEAAHKYAAREGLPCIITLYSTKDSSRKSKLFERHGRRIMEGYQFKPAGGDFLTGQQEQGNGLL